MVYKKRFYQLNHFNKYIRTYLEKNNDHIKTLAVNINVTQIKKIKPVFYFYEHLVKNNIVKSDAKNPRVINYFIILVEKCITLLHEYLLEKPMHSHKWSIMS